MAGIFDPGIFDSGIFDDAASGSALNRTATDAPTTSDSVTRTLVGSRSATAAPTISDVATRAQVLFRSAAEAISTADVAARASVLARATADAPTTADTVTRTAVLSRADSESITASDAAVIASVARTTSDAPTTSDAATRALTASRAASDVPTTTDAATRSGALSRTVSDAPTTADAATRSNGVARTATDAPTTSDVATRSGTLGRAATDAPTTAGTVTRSAVLSRTTTDSPTTSDTPFATSTNVSRTATQSMSTADAATWARNVVRATTEAVSASVAATRAVVLSRNVTQTLTGADVVLNVPVPYLPGPVIYIDGVNITKADGDPVVFSTARFMSAVNGVAGEAHFRVRDDLGTSTYVPGQPLSLVIDGQATWTGFITNVKRVYAFPALNVDDFGPTRFFDIDGTDLNILFSRRIVFNTAHPENVLAPLYSLYTPDVTAISDLLAGWLDLSGDALDTSSDVHHVGAINADQLARAWEGSDTWGQAMQSITALPASIYYIRPNREFAYVDTDTPDAPFGLSDVPNGTTSKGYREMEVLFDGTNLANDVLAWGVGYGSTSPVFTRAEDATSQSEHGLWQVGQTAFGIYKQATIDRVADSILNGSPDHHRGAKDDRHAVTITTYEPGLLPAQKLLFESNVFGYSEVLPIRKMEITFPTPTTPRYELTLSQEIDVPWSFFDVFRIPGFGFKLPGFTFPPFPPIITPSGCTDCGITDTYTRTVAEVVHGTNAGSTDADIGTSDAGVDYFNLVNGHQAWLLSGGGVGLSVSGSALVARLFSNAGTGLVFGTAAGYLRTTVPMDHSATKSMTFTLSALPAAGSTLSVAIPGGAPSGTKAAHVFLNPSSVGLTQSYIGFTATLSDAQAIPDSYWQAGVIYTLTLLDDGVGTTITIGVGTGVDYSHTSATYTGDTIQNPQLGLTSNTIGGSSTAQYVVTIDDLDIPEITRCSNFEYDTFGRTTASGWGNASSGPAWDAYLDGAASGTMSVTYGQGNMDLGALTNGNAETPDAGPWNATDGFVGSFRFQTSALGTVFIDVSDQGGNFEFTAKTSNSSGFVEMASTGDSTVSKTDWVASTWYAVKYEYRPSGVARAKVWELDSIEPLGWTVSTTAYPDTISAKLRFVGINGSGGSVSIDWAAIDFDYTGKPCYLGGPPPATGGALFSPQCEVAVRVDSTHYQLSLAVAPGTDTVYEGTPGFLLLPGIARDYVIDIASGLITLADAVADGTRIYVCYTAAGPVS